MKLKVCGLSNQIEVETCVNNGVNYCGFILNYPRSHRYISFNQANSLTQINKKNSKYVGVLVSPSNKELEKFSLLNLDFFQIYGNYDSKSLLEIKRKFKKKIIYALQIKKKEDVEMYKAVENGSDILLWDSSGYEDSISWNYEWIKTISVKTEKMIAGNITIDKLNNISKLAEIIDVSGALETNKVKDIYKIKKFIDQVKKINDKN
jgi:phosphoribosylanthranilate isomerase